METGEHINGFQKTERFRDSYQSDFVDISIFIYSSTGNAQAKTYPGFYYPFLVFQLSRFIYC